MCSGNPAEDQSCLHDSNYSEIRDELKTVAATTKLNQNEAMTGKLVQFHI